MHRIYPSILENARELRQPQTPAEAALWPHLRNRRCAYKFRRQHPVERFIVDFYCAEAKLCIEIDGASHFSPQQKEYDATRTAFLEQLGYQVIRFTNDEVRYNLQSVVEEIIAQVELRLSPHPAPLPTGERKLDESAPLPSREMKPADSTPSPWKGEGRGEGQPPA